MLSALLPVFAIEQSVTEITDSTSITDNSFVIKGYYKGELATNVTFVINDLSGKQLYQSYADATDADHVNSTSNIFTWRMSGRTRENKTVTVRFTFTQLQAVLDDKYYRPEYTMKMGLNKSVVTEDYGTTRDDRFYTQNTNPKLVNHTGNNNSNISASKSGPSDSRFVDSTPVYVQYSDYIRNSSTYANWTRSGYCTLHISSFEDSTPGDYEYTCTVIVEITV